MMQNNQLKIQVIVNTHVSAYKHMLYNINGTFFFSYDFYKLQALLRHDDFVGLHRRKVIFIAFFRIALNRSIPNVFST